MVVEFWMKLNGAKLTCKMQNSLKNTNLFCPYSYAFNMKLNLLPLSLKAAHFNDLSLSWKFESFLLTVTDRHVGHKNMNIYILYDNHVYVTISSSQISYTLNAQITPKTSKQSGTFILQTSHLWIFKSNSLTINSKHIWCF